MKVSSVKLIAKQNFCSVKNKKTVHSSKQKNVTFSALLKTITSKSFVINKTPFVENIISSIKKIFTSKAKAYMLAEGISQKNIDIIKRERPYLNEMMTVIHAKRLQRVEEGKIPWVSGPVDDYERQVFTDFAKSDAYRQDRIAQIKKISRPEDEHIPIQKRDLPKRELDLLREQFDNGDSHFNEDDIFDFYNMIRTSKPIDKSAIVYRGIIPRFNMLKNHSFIENLKEGDKIVRSEYTSTAPVYDFAVDMFNANSDFSGSFSKGYIMRIALPKGTKGIDYRGVDLFNGQQSEFVLPPNSEIFIKKIDHANQIMECEYKLPKEDNFLPKPEFENKIKKDWEYEDVMKEEYYEDEQGFLRASSTEKTTYPNREIVNDIELIGNMTKSYVKRDIETRPDGSTVEVITDYIRDKYTKITKTIKNAQGKILFKDTLQERF